MYLSAFAVASSARRFDYFKNSIFDSFVPFVRTKNPEDADKNENELLFLRHHFQ